MGVGNIYSQLGIAGILIFLFLREMFSYLKTRGNAKNSHLPNPSCPLNATIELWEQKLSHAVVVGINEALAPTLERQTDILKSVANSQGKILELLIREDERRVRQKAE